jgi:hypothetical protein
MACALGPFSKPVSAPTTWPVSTQCPSNERGGAPKPITRLAESRTRQIPRNTQHQMDFEIFSYRVADGRHPVAVITVN